MGRASYYSLLQLPRHWRWTGQCNDFGWPVVAPTRYAASLPEEKTDLTGAFRVLFHGQDTNAVGHVAVDAEFHGGGTVSGSVGGSYEAGETLRLNLDGVEYRDVYCVLGSIPIRKHSSHLHGFVRGRADGVGRGGRRAGLILNFL